MIIQYNLEQYDQAYNQGFDSNEQPDLQDPVLEEYGMYQSFQARPQSEGDCHEYVGGLEAIHIREEVSRQFTILIIVKGIAAYCHQQDGQHEEDSQYFDYASEHVETEEDLKVTGTEEYEVFKIVLYDQLDQDQDK